MRCVAALLSIFGVLLAASAHATVSQWTRNQTANMHRISGRFIQEDYGFSLQAPEPWGGYITNGGDANHGMTAILGDRRSIVLFPEYIDGEGDWSVPCGPKLSVGEPATRGVQRHVRLGGLSACEAPFASRGWMWRIVQAERGDGSDIMYTMILRTNSRHLRGDEMTFEEMMRSFRRARITP